MTLSQKKLHEITSTTYGKCIYHSNLLNLSWYNACQCLKYRSQITDKKFKYRISLNEVIQGDDITNDFLCIELNNMKFNVLLLIDDLNAKIPHNLGQQANGVNGITFYNRGLFFKFNINNVNVFVEFRLKTRYINKIHDIINKEKWYINLDKYVWCIYGQMPCSNCTVPFICTNKENINRLVIYIYYDKKYLNKIHRVKINDIDPVNYKIATKIHNQLIEKKKIKF